MEPNYIQLMTGTEEPTIEQAIEALLKVRNAKAKLVKKLKMVEAAEAAFETWLLRALVEQKLDKVVAHGVHVSTVSKVVPIVTSWDHVYDWIRETGQLNILHKRLAVDRVRALAEQDDLPPGIRMVELASLSIRSVRPKFDENLTQE